MSITQVYMPGQVTIPVTGPTTGPLHLVHVTHAPTVAQNGQVCVAMVDVSDGSITINSGSWDGATFTIDAANPRKAYLVAPATKTVSQLVGFVTPGKSTATAATLVPAFQIITTGATCKAHVRVEGITKQVTP